ncbi:MAG: SurA N-terminal domain-containing protein [Tannerella sp.]|jgi:peptidyl-prolyl cis-trans isomerase D|nr:SurA N-terminal domain-containing protein [Tannerella sp.]
MATLEKIRSHAGLLVVVVGLALFAFIIGDLLNSGSSYFRAPQDEVAQVEGVSINYQHYQDRVEEMTNVYKMQNNTSTLPEEYGTQIRQSVYSSMIQEIVLNKALDKIGMKVTPEELFDMIQGENVFPMVQQIPLFFDPQTGVFSKTRALNILKTIENLEAVPQQQRAELENIRNYWLFWERNIKLQRLENKYTTLLSKAIVANPIDAKNAYEGTTESSDIVYAMQSYATLPDTLFNVSDGEAKKLYDQRKEQFKQKEARVVDYIAVDIRPSQEDYEKIGSDIEKIKIELAEATENIEDVVNDNSEIPYVNAFLSEKELEPDMASFVSTANINEIEGPVFKDESYRLLKLVDKTNAVDSVKISHIVLTDQSGGDVTALADSLLAVLKAGGDFEELAGRYSADQSNATQGGELGWYTEIGALRTLGEEFKNAVFASTVTTSQPFILKTSYGAHIIKVTEKTAVVPKYKVAYVYLAVSPSTKTYGHIYNDLNQFLAKNNTAEKINVSAAEAGYNLVPNVKVTTEDRLLGAITDSRQVIRWAFESSSKNEVSKIFECKNHFVLAVRKGVLAEGYQSFNAVKQQLKSELISKKKGEEIVKELKAKNLQTIDAYAQAMNAHPDTVRFITLNTPRIANIGLEPTLNAEITYTPVNQLGGPVIGHNGVYIFSVLNRTQEAGEYDEQKEVGTLESTNAYRVGYQAIQALVESAKIEDRRIRFD